MIRKVHTLECMDIFVMKFGGLALATPKDQMRVVQIISSSDRKVLAVCSAMGRAGFPYSTANLELLAPENFLAAKERDRLLGCGEVISSLRMSYLLNQNRKRAYALSFSETGICCDLTYGEGKILSLNGEKIRKLFDTYDILVVPGFIGISQEKELITLGRGNSDLTAAVCAFMTDQKKAVLYKNVDGVFHTPPTVFTRVMCYRKLSYDEMIALNDIGFGIVSRSALEFSKEKNIVLEIRNYETDQTGTAISSEESGDLILGINLNDRTVKIATFYPCRVKELILSELEKIHIFVREERIEENYYEFDIQKSVINSVKRLLIGLMETVNKTAEKKDF